MKDLYYLHGDVLQSVPYSRDRAMSVSPLFYDNRVAGLIALQQRCEERKNHYTCRLVEIEAEIAREKGK